MNISSTTTLALALLAMPLTAQDPNTPAPPPFKPFTAAETDRYMALGKQVTGWFLAGHADSVLTAFGPEMAEQIGLEGIRNQMDTFAERAGTVISVLDEKLTRRNGMPQFWWEANVTNFSAEPVVMRWLFDEEGKIIGAGMNPKSRAIADPEG